MRCLLFMGTMCMVALMPEFWCATSHHRHHGKETHHHPSATGYEQHATSPKHKHSRPYKHKPGHRQPRTDTATPSMSITTKDSHNPEYFNVDVKAEMMFKGHYAECPGWQRLVCRHDPCKYLTCEDAAGGGCPLTTLNCEHDAFVCDCHNALGYFRRNATSTECLHKNHSDCIAARKISCRDNETAVCEDAENGCQWRNCYFFYLVREKRKNGTAQKRDEICEWSETQECAKKYQHCRCSNGYVLNEQIMKCVLPKDCTHYWWNTTVTAKNIDTLRTVAIQTGQDLNGNDMFICKYDDPKTQDVLLGKYRLGHPAWPIAADNKEEFDIYEYDERFVHVSILCMLPGALKWVQHEYNEKDKNLPDNAYLAGYANNKPQYIGMANYLDNPQYGTPGKELAPKLPDEVTFAARPTLSPSDITFATTTCFLQL